jgi:hypothetical protein
MRVIPAPCHFHSFHSLYILRTSLVAAKGVSASDLIGVV